MRNSELGIRSGLSFSIPYSAFRTPNSLSPVLLLGGIQVVNIVGDAEEFFFDRPQSFRHVRVGHGVLRPRDAARQVMELPVVERA